MVYTCGMHVPIIYVVIAYMWCMHVYILAFPMHACDPFILDLYVTCMLLSCYSSCQYHVTCMVQKLSHIHTCYMKHACTLIKWHASNMHFRELM